jgi:hypothetical protein
MLRAPITNVDHFSVAPITGAHYFCVACQYPRVHNFGSCTNTCCVQFLCRVLIFHVHFTLRVAPCQSLVCPPPCTSTLRAPLTKLSCDNIYPHCACTNKIPLRSVNTVHTMRAIIMCVHTMCQYYACATQSTPCNAKFSAHTHAPKFFALPLCIAQCQI